MDFKQKYPLELKEAILTPMIIRENMPSEYHLPDPKMAGIRDLAEYCGYSYSAIRTALSRMKSIEAIIPYTDPEGVSRYRIGPFGNEVNKFVHRNTSPEKGFTLVIFSFKTENERERQKIRDDLKYFGFKKLAQNTYINLRIDPSRLMEDFRNQGLEEHVFLFETGMVSDSAMRERILNVFDIQGRSKILEAYFSALKVFLEEPGIDSLELGKRICYCGAVTYRVTFVDEPPFPEEFLPEDYPQKRIRDYLSEVEKANMDQIADYYLRYN